MSTTTLKQAPLSEKERDAFATAYRFYERWHTIQGASQDWEALAMDIVDLPDDMRNDELCQRLICTIIEVLSDRQKRREDEDRTAAKQTVMTDANGRPVTCQ